MKDDEGKTIRCYRCGCADITVTENEDEWTNDEYDEALSFECTDMALIKCVKCNAHW